MCWVVAPALVGEESPGTRLENIGAEEDSG